MRRFSVVLVLLFVGGLVGCRTTDPVESTRLRASPNADVEIELQFVTFGKDDVATLVGKESNMVAADALFKLKREGKGILLYAPRIVTHNGSEASIKGSFEEVYPSSLAAKKESDEGSATDNSSQINRPAELEFSTQETGVVATVIPEIAFDSKKIMWSAHISLVLDPVWRKHDLRTPDGTTASVVEQPIFGTQRLEACGTLPDGEMMLVGGGTPTTDGKSMVYVFISARIVPGSM